MVEWNENLTLRSILFVLVSDILYVVKSYDMVSPVPPPQKEGVLRFIAFKNILAQAGLNPQTLSSIVSTIIITPPRRHFAITLAKAPENCK
jgi:hypothetical protein